MTLVDYLKAAGMTEDTANEIAAAHEAGSVRAWLEGRGLSRTAIDALLGLVKGWQTQLPAEMRHLEMITIRPGCSYELTTLPEGRHWRVMLRQVTFPGPMEAASWDGTSPRSWSVVAAEYVGGFYRWATLSPAAKERFGQLLQQRGTPEGQWVTVREYDHDRGETMPTA